jgi:hypothetical protein
MSYNYYEPDCDREDQILDQFLDLKYEEAYELVSIFFDTRDVSKVISKIEKALKENQPWADELCFQMDLECIHVAALKGDIGYLWDHLNTPDYDGRF